MEAEFSFGGELPLIVLLFCINKLPTVVLQYILSKKSSQSKFSGLL